MLAVCRALMLPLRLLRTTGLPASPGYYSVLFEDPDGIRIEANFVPGKGPQAGSKDAA